ncbi:cell division cycle-associated protein 7-like isoform X2 [Anguilla rostrata]|uniref:cell division cycle-associated protein 7-like isoform X2 n=1 Tax=Anguilla rostrata TaxID=7938 RepID=UPI0030CF1F3F
MEKEGHLELSSLSRQLSDIFAEDSDNEKDRTFHGFCDDEISDLDNDKCLDSDDCSENSSPKQSPPPSQRFTLRVALRPRTRANQREETKLRDAKKEKESGGGNDIPLIQPTLPSNSDSENDFPQSFLEKRALNIKSNKAMLAQLMADLQKMPDSLLKTPGGRQKRPNAVSSPHVRAPRTSLAPSESRRNPERTSRRHTRSMGGCVDPIKDEELEMSLEEELLEVRRAPRRRGSPRPNPSRPHVVRPVEDVTQEELELVADSLVGKVYNSATGSTCHQCRQKTVDTKTCCRDEGCRGIQGQFCGPCLRNRYGEDVRTALLDPPYGSSADAPYRCVLIGPLALLAGLALPALPRDLQLQLLPPAGRPLPDGDPVPAGTVPRLLRRPLLPQQSSSKTEN